MNEIVEALIKTVNESKVLNASNMSDNLNLLIDQDRLCAITSLPISVVNQHSRIKSADVKDDILTQGLYDENGEAYKTYSVETLQPLVYSYPSLFQTIDIAIVDKETTTEVSFTSKRPNDYWTRMNNCESVRAMVKVTFVEPFACLSTNIEKEVAESSNGQWSLESQLRDDMRSKKENPLLRQKQYIALYIITEDEHSCNAPIKAMLEHYFQDNIVVKEGKTSYCIGYAAMLDEVSLRTFYKKRL